MDCDAYLEEAKSQLSYDIVYKPLKQGPTIEYKKIIDIIEDAFIDNIIHKKSIA